MARLIQVRLQDFRAFRTAQMDLSHTGLVFVTGQNNAGKSALLSALDVIAGRDKPAAARHVSGSSMRVWARFQLTDEERAALLGDVPETTMQMQAGAAPWIEWEFAEVEQGTQAVAIRTLWITGEELVIGRLDVDAAGPYQWHLRTLTDPLSKWDRVSYHDSSMSSPPHAALEQPQVFQHVGESIRWILPRWRAGYFHMDPLRQTPPGPKPAKAAPILASDGSNLTDVLHDMKSNREDLWRNLQDLISELVPSVGTLSLPATSSELEIVFKHQLGQETIDYPLKSLGTGVEQLLMMLVAGLTRSATTVVLEDPEVGLHPAVQRSLLSLLQRWSEDRLIMAATHSATMLDWTSPTTTILSVAREGMQSVVSVIPSRRSEALEVLHSLGVRTSDALTADRVLMLEGPTEMNILDLWFPEIMRSPRLAVVPAGGGYNAHLADRFAGWLDAIDKLDSRKILYLRDRDELSTEFIRKLEESPNIAVLPCREFENLLLDFPALAAVISRERLQRKSEPITAGQVEAAARVIADGLKQVVVLKRTMADFADPLRLVDNKLRQRLGKPTVQLADLAAELAARVPVAEGLRVEVEAAGKRHADDVAATWEDDWLRLAPGDELLTGIYMEYLDRGYNKLDDGLSIAKEMAPPSHLRELLGSFMT